MFAVEEVAEAVLCCAANRKVRVSNLKLQKLLYYAHGWSLAVRNEPLFSARIEAWVHGPVVPSIFRAYRGHKWDDIPAPCTPVNADPSLVAWCDAVMSRYGSFAAKDLERMTHRERPWIDARGPISPDTPSNALITDEALKSYFASRLANG